MRERTCGRLRVVRPDQTTSMCSGSWNKASTKAFGSVTVSPRRKCPAMRSRCAATVRRSRSVVQSEILITDTGGYLERRKGPGGLVGLAAPALKGEEAVGRTRRAHSSTTNALSPRERRLFGECQT